MALLCQDPGDTAATPQLTLAAAVAQRRVIVVKLPYSDLGNLPPLHQLPLKVRMVSSVAVPLETRQLIRRIQRADQLTVAINLQVRAALVLGILSSSNIFLCSEKLTRHADGSRSFGVHRFDLCGRKIPSTTGKHVI